MGEKGLTLIELMIVVALIGLLAAIGIPQYAETVRCSQEATTKGNLAALRGAVNLYYADHEGMYPTDNLTSLIPLYIQSIPLRYVPPYHPPDNDVSAGSMSVMETAHDAWFYANNPTESQYFGTVEVNCTHMDLHGDPWNTL